MKHFMFSNEGICQIADADLLRWRAQGSFMNASGPTTFPIRLVPTDAEAMRTLMGKAKNFAFWLTQDFRICFTTKEGVIDGGGKTWKIRFEWRGVGKDGKTGVSGARFERRVTPEEALPAIEGVIAQLAAQIAQQSPAAPSGSAEPAS